MPGGLIAPVIGLIRAAAVGIRTGVNRLACCKIGSSDDDVLEDSLGRGWMIPRPANLFKSVAHMGCQSSFTRGRRVKNDIAVAGFERNEPLIDNRCGRLQAAI